MQPQFNQNNKEMTLSNLFSKAGDIKTNELIPEDPNIISKKIESETEILVENSSPTTITNRNKSEFKQSTIIKRFDYNNNESKIQSQIDQSIVENMNLTMFKELMKKKDPKINVLVTNSKIINNIGKKFIKKNKFDEIFEDCKKKNKKFTDSEFPPDQTSLSKKWDGLTEKQRNSWKNYVWRRAGEIFGNDYDIFYQEIEPNDIRQGNLGNCYLLSSLSSLAERPYIVKKIFHTVEKNDYGIYSVWFNSNGTWTNIIIDDYFPCLNEKAGPAFSRANGNELWVLIIEKAYAKMFGSYHSIEGGNPAVALRDLTGAPYENKDEGSQEEMWKYIQSNDRAGIRVYVNN